MIPAPLMFIGLLATIITLIILLVTHNPIFVYQKDEAGSIGVQESYFQSARTAWRVLLLILIIMNIILTLVSGFA